MPDWTNNDSDKEKVEYLFEGNTTSLDSATKRAISDLESYEMAVRRATSFRFEDKGPEIDFSKLLRHTELSFPTQDIVPYQVESIDISALAQGVSRFRSYIQILRRAIDFTSNLVSVTNKAYDAIGSFLGEYSTYSILARQAASSTSIFEMALRALEAVGITDMLSESINLSMDYIENLNLFRVAMADSVDIASAFVDEMQELYGMDPSNLMRYAGNFYQLATAIEMPDKSAQILSLSLTKVANDLASLFNMDIDTVYTNLASGMQGMTRAVRKYGLDLRMATLQQEAAALGITENVSTMSEANRQGLRYITIIKQASKADGDFAKTIESPSNQLRIFKEQVSQLGRAIGDFFIIPLRNAVQYANGFIMAMREVLTYIAGLLGITKQIEDMNTSIEGGSEDLEDMGSAADDAANKVKKLLAPFDELNVLTDSTNALEESDILDPRIAAAMEALQLKLDDVFMKARQVRDDLLELLGFDGTVIEGNLSWSWDNIDFDGIAQTLIDKLNASFASIGVLNLFDPTRSQQISNSIDKVLKEVRWDLLSSKFSSNVNSVLSGFNYAVDTFPWSTVGSSIETLLTTTITTIDWSQVARALLTGVRISLKTIAGFFENITPQEQQEISNAISTFINSLALEINTLFDENESSFENIGTTLGTILNTTISNIDATQLGKSAMAVVNTGITIASSLLDQIDIDQLATSVADYIAGAWNSIDKVKLGNILGSVIRFSVTRAFKTLNSLNWAQITVDIADLIVGMKWGDIFDTVTTELAFWILQLPKALTDIVETAVLKLLEDAVENVLSSFGIETDLNWGQHYADMVGENLKKNRESWDKLTGAAKDNEKKTPESSSLNGSGVDSGSVSREGYSIKMQLVDKMADKYIDKTPDENQTFVEDLKGEIIQTASTSFWGTLATNAWTAITDLFGGNPLSKYAVTGPDGKTIRFATGGVVTSPTSALIGEAGKSEAVIPLDNSPQMQDLIEKIADRVDQKADDKAPIEVRVFIGDSEWDAFTYKSAQRGKNLVGTQPITVT